MSFLASDIMDSARIFLNDNAATLYTNTSMVPYVRKSNENLETLLLANGVQVQNVKSTAITVAANALTLTLPADFLVPIRLYERDANDAQNDWIPMTEKIWEPEDVIPTNTLRFWAFRNNRIYFIGSIVTREVLLEYSRQLAVITGENSPEDFVLSKNYLAAKTAELCARYIGMNKDMADDIATREVIKAEDELIRIFVLASQGTPQRRPRFRTN